MKLFVINPGSTSTKLSFYHDDKQIYNEEIFHDSSDLKQYPTINDQLDYRCEVMHNFIVRNKIDMNDIDAIACRGGSCVACEGGTYIVNERMYEDIKNARGGFYHSSMLGVQMGKRLQDNFGGILLTCDPPVTDEYSDIARITGVKGIYRRSAVHALNLKAVCQKFASEQNKKYEDLNLIAAHIDGGITVTAHYKGKMIDGNDGGGGDGPFTPTRMGSMAVTDVVDYLWDKPKSEMKQLLSVSGGLSSYFGTSDCDKIRAKNDEFAEFIWQAMLYQSAKVIGSMAVVLKGKIDALILTGGLLRFKDVEETIKEYCGFIAPIYTYPGEYEQDALALAALRVLNGEKAKEYTGNAVFTGFKEEA